MSSPSTQFATSTRMGIYEPFHQISMWEDTFKVDITPNTGLSTVVQIDSKLDNNVKFIESGYTSHESLGPSGNNQEANHTSEKVKRRLAQNREAARKSRLRKKAYVQQLETSRLKLAQMELELQRARHQGLYIGGHIGLSSPVNTGIAAFEMEYGLWIDEQQRKNFELRNVMQAHISDIELQIFVESGFNHYYDLFRMKADAAKADAFYLISGTWRTSVERFFLWIGGFRPSELLNNFARECKLIQTINSKSKLRGCKIIMPQLEPLTDQQHLNFCTLRQSSQQAEEALSLGMEKLQQTVVQSITTDPYGSQMASAVENLEALETFVSQADHLRQQTLQQMSRVLTTRQAARGLLALGEYFQRLRALSSLWAARRREST